ncbi:restriction endonuclease [Shewanella colwelliana]|uniref:restriction endonuclease n=1 Tax=Shewanella colwelliana TaxID=23 RepID=UPI0022AF0771|nr:restriction endonuclease [Shewanella colwelliana]MCZ4337702.1 restriction endonuclease [Shewanella colwelliana]
MSIPLSALQSPILWATIVVTLSFLILLWPKKDSRWRVESSKRLFHKLQKLNGGEVICYLRKVDCFVFEELLLTSIARFNPSIQIVRNSRYTGDGGADGAFELEGKKFIIQAKRYEGFVNTADVLKLSKDVAKFDAVHGLFVHVGKTRNTTFCKCPPNVTIVSGEQVVAWVKRGKLPMSVYRAMQDDSPGISQSLRLNESY